MKYLLWGCLSGPPAECFEDHECQNGLECRENRCVEPAQSMY